MFKKSEIIEKIVKTINKINISDEKLSCAFDYLYLNKYSPGFITEDKEYQGQLINIYYKDILRYYLIDDNENESLKITTSQGDAKLKIYTITTPFLALVHYAFIMAYIAGILEETQALIHKRLTNKTLISEKDFELKQKLSIIHN